MEKTENRNYGIDLLRIVSMIMVVILNILSHGGILGACEAGSFKYWTLWFLEAAAYCAVNCYALISGYVGVKAKHKYVNIMVMYLQVAFYRVISTAIFVFFVPGVATGTDLFQAFFPFAYNSYWYFVAYFCMFFFIPFMNKLLNSLSKKEAKVLSVSLIIMFCILPYIFNKDLFKTGGGYSVLWIAALYMLGGIVRLFAENKTVKKSTCIYVYIISAAVAIFSKASSIFQSTMINYTSPAMLAAAISLLFLFANIKISKAFIKKCILFFTPMVFSVYLIHTEHFVWNNVLGGIFSSYAELNVFVSVLAVIGTAIAIFVLCAFIDYIRVLLFKLLNVRKFCEYILNKIENAYICIVNYARGIKRTHEKKSFLERMYSLFIMVFVSSFSYIILNAIFNKKVYNHSTAIIFFIGIPCIILLCVIYNFLKKKHTFTKKYYPIFVACAAIILFTVQMLSVNHLRYLPMFDLEAIYAGAQEWLFKGTFEKYTSRTMYANNYYYLFPNNLGALTYFYLLFKAAYSLGINDFFMVASVANGILFTLTMVFTSLICKKLSGAHTGIFVLILFLITPPFYFIAPVFYTDSLSLIYPVVSFYIFLIAKDRKNMVSKLLLYAASAAICAIGGLIRMTVLIILVAVAINLIINKKWKNLIAYLCIHIVIISAIFSGFNSYMYTNHLDKERADREKMPVHYWLDLATNGTGFFSNRILAGARKIETYEERKEHLTEEIKENISNKGFSGIISLISHKGTFCFGDGSFELNTFLGHRPINKEGFLYQYVHADGKYYDNYRSVCTGIFMVILVLMAASGFTKDKNKVLFIPRLCVFGLLMYLLCWEIKNRYIINFLPFIYMSASIGMDMIGKKIKSIKEFIEQE